MRYCLFLLLLFPLSRLLRQYAANQEAPTQQKSRESQKNPPAPSAQLVAKPEQRQPGNGGGVPPWTDPFWSNWALVGITGVAAWIALGTLNDLKEQTAATRALAETAKGISETARDNATAANKTADAALLNAQAVIKSERPWITGIEGDGGFKLFSNPAFIPKFSLAIKNSGRTPAKLTRVLMKFEMRTSLDDLRGLDHDLDITCICPLPYVLLIPGDLPFTVTATLTGNSPLTGPQMVGIKDGKLFLIAYGVIEYEDVFDTPDRCHRSGFFFYYAFGSPASHGFQTYYSAPSDYLEVT
jgi:hypothetical protein